MRVSLLSTRLAATLLLTVVAGTDLDAQPDGVQAYPAVYSVPLENPWVRVTRVRLPAGANLGMHSHPAGFMFHVYLNDAESVLFSHDGPPYDVMRPPVSARSYRIGTATPETHAVSNPSSGHSDYLRIEYQTRGTERSRRRVSAPPLGAASSSDVEHEGELSRVTRVTIAAGDSTVVATTATQPALVVLVTDGTLTESGVREPHAVTAGQERFVDTGSRLWLRNAGTRPLQLLRFDFLTPPGAPR